MLQNPAQLPQRTLLTRTLSDTRNYAATFARTNPFCRPELNKSLWNVLEQVHRGGVYTAENVYLQNGLLVMETKAHNITIDQSGKPTNFYVSSGA